MSQLYGDLVMSPRSGTQIRNHVSKGTCWKGRGVLGLTCGAVPVVKPAGITARGASTATEGASEARREVGPGACQRGARRVEAAALVVWEASVLRSGPLPLPHRKGSTLFTCSQTSSTSARRRNAPLPVRSALQGCRTPRMTRRGPPRVRRAILGKGARGASQRRAHLGGGARLFVKAAKRTLELSAAVRRALALAHSTPGRLTARARAWQSEP